MLIRDIGEFRLIQLLAETLTFEGVEGPNLKQPDAWSPRVGIGDDAAVWEGEAGTRVLTTDAMVEGVHFELGLTGWRDLGWKAMAVNLSDIAAMGCLPTLSVVTLGLRDNLPVDGLVEMYRGIADACRSHGGQVVGGDIVRSPVFFVSVAMEGQASITEPDGRGAILTRGAAEIGDVIAVTGSLGDSAGGLRMAQAGEGFDDSTERLRAAHFRPEPRLAAGQALARAGIRAAMDISDGLVGDLTKLCEASDVGAVVRGHEVPTSDALRKPVSRRLAFPCPHRGRRLRAVVHRAGGCGPGGQRGRRRSGDDHRRDRRSLARSDRGGRGWRCDRGGPWRLGPLRNGSEWRRPVT